MQIVSGGNNLHEMLNTVFLEKQETIFQNVVCWKFYPECEALVAYIGLYDIFYSNRAYRLHIRRD